MNQMNSSNVLVVDDEEDICELLGSSLTAAGFNVTTATTGRSAIEILKLHPIGAVVSDVSMADGDGIELFDTIRRCYDPGPLLVFMTGMADFTLDDARQIGAAAVYPKPIDIRGLVQFLSENRVVPGRRRAMNASFGEMHFEVELPNPMFSSQDAPIKLDLKISDGAGRTANYCFDLGTENGKSVLRSGALSSKSLRLAHAEAFKLITLLTNIESGGHADRTNKRG